MGQKAIIAVDVDEVLAYFMPALAKYHNETYGGVQLTSDSFTSYEFHNVWGGTKEETLSKMENFFESPYFKEQIDPLPGAYEALLQLKQRYNLHIITSRQHKLEDITKKWIHTHFPDIFSELHFGNHYATEGKKRSKPEMCREIGAKLLIDDSLVYATQCVQAGIPVVLFGNYAWNQTNSMLQSDYHHSATACPFNQLDGLEIKHYPHECDGSSIKYHSKLIYRTAKWEEVPQLVEIIIKNTN